MSRRARAGGPEVVTIYWRDIPAQVNGQSGRDRHQVVLSAKFQRAVDRAKRKAGIYTAEEDIAQWRRVSTPCGDDIAAAAAAVAAELEQSLSREYLGRLAYAGGFVADLVDDDVDRDELLALEELDDDPITGDDDD
ncbi:MAG: virulence factor [Ilumatobacteraceae bacterium]